MIGFYSFSNPCRRKSPWVRGGGGFSDIFQKSTPGGDHAREAAMMLQWVQPAYIKIAFKYYYFQIMPPQNVFIEVFGVYIFNISSIFFSYTEKSQIYFLFNYPLVNS